MKQIAGFLLLMLVVLGASACGDDGKTDGNARCIETYAVDKGYGHEEIIPDAYAFLQRPCDDSNTDTVCTMEDLRALCRADGGADCDGEFISSEAAACIAALKGVEAVEGGYYRLMLDYPEKEKTLVWSAGLVTFSEKDSTMHETEVRLHAVSGNFIGLTDSLSTMD